MFQFIHLSGWNQALLRGGKFSQPRSGCGKHQTTQSSCCTRVKWFQIWGQMLSGWKPSWKRSVHCRKSSSYRPAFDVLKPNIQQEMQLHPNHIQNCQNHDVWCSPPAARPSCVVMLIFCFTDCSLVYFTHVLPQSSQNKVKLTNIYDQFNRLEWNS